MTELSTGRGSASEVDPALRPAPLLLVTGFGPFEGCDRNPSGEAVEKADGATIEGIRVVGRRIEVSWQRAWPAIEREVEILNPVGLLALGVAPHSFIRLEVIAKNVCLPDRDVDGERPSLGRMLNIVDDAPPAYWTTLPVNEIEERMRRRGATDPWSSEEGPGVPITRWTDAGSYLCNYVFFMAMHRLRCRVPHVGFAHVPPFRTAGASHGVEEGKLLEAIESLIHEVAILVGKDARIMASASRPVTQ